jgi:hypothetical protein
MSDYTSAEVTKMLDYMMAAIGDRYTQQNPERFGPGQFDCSGLVWRAMQQAGMNLPQSDAIAATEADYLSKQPGVEVIKSANQVQKGDVVFFTGADPGPSNFGGIGHVGVATSSSQYVSAYDTQEGVVVNPIGSGNGGFVVAMRLAGGPGGGGGGGGSPTTGGLGINWDPNITGFFSEADSFVTGLMWLTQPSSWLRIGAFLVGVALLLFAIYAFVAISEGRDVVPSMQGSVPLPIPV